MILHGIAFIFFILCFLFGMTWLRSGLFNIANQKIKKLGSIISRARLSKVS